uniref:Uncharacterized protein n=1 Tax=Glaucocystis sp. BBH TaxID=2023628 RepID=A0A3G1IV76_9EUKA|nr:hypothetical protein [Glaucocystis sp. BBH]
MIRMIFQLKHYKYLLILEVVEVKSTNIFMDLILLLK